MNVGDHTNPNEEGMEYIGFLRMFREQEFQFEALFISSKN